MTASEWYVSRQGKQYGPNPWDRIVQMPAGKQILPDDLVWGPGLAAWTRVAGTSEVALRLPSALAGALAAGLAALVAGWLAGTGLSFRSICSDCSGCRDLRFLDAQAC